MFKEIDGIRGSLLCRVADKKEKKEKELVEFTKFLVIKTLVWFGVTENGFYAKVYPVRERDGVG